jgi:transcriptional regulator with XRE-family HTH domain
MARKKKAPVKRAVTKRGVSDDDMTVGQRIKLIRVERAMSQEQLGAALNVSFQQIQKYEKGANRVSSGRLMEIANTLKTTPHELMGWQDGGAKSAIDPETYKLAKAFLGLREEYKGAIRQLIGVLVRVELD